MGKKTYQEVLRAHLRFTVRISREASERSCVFISSHIRVRPAVKRWYRVRMLPGKRNGGGGGKDKGICKGAIIIMNMESGMSIEEVRS